MINVLICVLILTVFVLCICVTGAIYCKNEKKREERKIAERDTDRNRNADAAITKMAMHNKYNGLNTRGRIN